VESQQLKHCVIVNHLNQTKSIAADQLDLEPTRSVLHHSAATLALECNELREAERLISRALSGFPPIDIAEELRNLLIEEIYSHREQISA
jgi:hypothetical protein